MVGTVKNRARRFLRSGHAYGEIEQLLKSVAEKGLCLDLPAGKGVNYEGIQNAGFTPVEADLFPALAGPPEAWRVKMDFTAGLPLGSASLAAVLCSEGIEHHPAQTSLIREFKRVLKAGGSLVITTPNTLNLRARFSTALNGHYSSRDGVVSEATQFWPAPDGSGTFVGHAHMIDYFELRFILKTNGFEIVQVTTAKFSSTSTWLLPIMYLPVWFSTRRLLKKKLQKHPDIQRELLQAALSMELLLGKKLIVLARRVG